MTNRGISYDEELMKNAVCEGYKDKSALDKYFEKELHSQHFENDSELEKEFEKKL